LADWGVPMTEAKIVAYIIANLAPFALILVLGLILFLVIRRRLSKATEADPQMFLDIARDVYRESYRIDDGGALELCGKVVTSKIDGIPVVTAKPAISKERKEVYQHNISIGHLSFEPGTANIGFSSGFGPDKSVWKFQLVVSADDVGARTISLQVDLRFAPAKIELKL